MIVNLFFMCTRISSFGILNPCNCLTILVMQAIFKSELFSCNSINFPHNSLAFQKCLPLFNSSIGNLHPIVMIMFTFISNFSILGSLFLSNGISQTLLMVFCIFVVILFDRILFFFPLCNIYSIKQQWPCSALTLQSPLYANLTNWSLILMPTIRYRMAWPKVVNR